MKKKLTVLGIPLLFILPWVSYLISLANIKSKMSAFIFIFFAGFLGYSIGFTNPSADSYRYAEAFMRFERPDSYLAIIQIYLDGGFRDIYLTSLFYITSFFSESPNVVYAIAGVIHGTIVYLNLRILIHERGSQTNRYTLILALLFITSCSLIGVNAFRFNTGAMLAFYCIYKLMIENKKLWLIGLFLTPLMHYSFILLIPVILILKLALPFTYNSSNVRPVVLYIFIATSILTLFVDTNLFNLGFLTQLDIVPDAAANRIDYVNSDEVSEIVEARAGDSLFLKVSSYFNYLITAYVLVVMLYIKRFIKNSVDELVSLNLMFSFTLLYYSFANIALSFPSGSRFMVIAHMFLIILLSKFYRNYKSSKIRRLILISILPFLFKILFTNIMLPILILTPAFWYGGFVGVVLENLGSIR
jgi:hypothetical protein